MAGVKNGFLNLCFKCEVQVLASHLVVGVWDEGAVSPLGEDDGLHVFPVQAATLWRVSRRLRRGVVVLEGGNSESSTYNTILLISPEYNKYLSSVMSEQVIITNRAATKL